jgi:phosphoglycerate dehydrogenase-like enzyme
MRRAVFNMQDERPVWAPPAWLAPRLRQALPAGWELVEVTAPVSGRGDGGGSSAEAQDAARGAEVYFGLGLPRALLLAALEPPSHLRWVHTGTAGVASLLHPGLVENGIILTNSAGIHAEPMADTVLAMVLHFFRGLDQAVRAQPRAAWETAPYEAVDSGIRELAGATIGIIGFGGIGRAVARRAAALGMNVVATRRRSVAGAGAADEPVREPDRAPQHVTVLTGEAGMQALLERSDVVVVTVPSTPDTRGLLGRAELARTRPGTIVVNVARGDVFDEGALVEALRSGHLRGAALDVFTTEPLPSDSPLWRLPNVLVTPHVSATSPRFWERQAELLLDNLARYLAGRPLRNVVDPAAGY